VLLAGDYLETSVRELLRELPCQPHIGSLLGGEVEFDDACNVNVPVLTINAGIVVVVEVDWCPGPADGVTTRVPSDQWNSCRSAMMPAPCCAMQ
jgi:hypothetical protein